MRKSIVTWTNAEGMSGVIDEYEADGYELISVAADKWEQYISRDNDGESKITDVTMYVLHFKQSSQEAKETKEALSK